MLTFGRTREPCWTWDLKRGPGWAGRLRRAADWLAREGLLGHRRRRRYFREVSAMLDADHVRAREEWCATRMHSWSQRSRGLSELLSLSTIYE